MAVTMSVEDQTLIGTKDTIDVDIIWKSMRELHIKINAWPGNCLLCCEHS